MSDRGPGRAAPAHRTPPASPLRGRASYLWLFAAVAVFAALLGRSTTTVDAQVEGAFSFGNLIVVAMDTANQPVMGYEVREGTTLEVTVVRTGGTVLTQDVQVVVELQGGIVDVDYPAATKTQQIIFTGGTNQTIGTARFTTFNRNRIYNTVCGDRERNGVPNTDPVQDCQNTVSVIIKSVSHGNIGNPAHAPVNIIGQGTPVLENIAPHSGEGGTTLTITGFNFTGSIDSLPIVITVEFWREDDIFATAPEATADPFQVENTRILVNVPALTMGFPNKVYHVRLRADLDGAVPPRQGRSAIRILGRFTAVENPGDPTVTFLSQRVGPTVGGTRLFITGTNFVPADCAGPPFNNVTFGGVAVSQCTFISSERLEVVSPPAPIGFTGTVHVRVRNSPQTVDSEFVYAGAPKITSISPSFGTASGGTAVTIIGTGFREPSALGQVNQVLFGGNPATNFTVHSDTQITAISPPLNVSVDTPVQIQVIHPATGASPNTTAATFTYTTGPAIIGLSPSSGPPQGGTIVTITGSGFAPGASVRFGNTAALFVTFRSSTVLEAQSPPGSGTVFVVVTVGGRSSAQTPEAQFRYSAPEIISIKPNGGPTAGGTNVTIEGRNFTEGSLVRFGTQTVAAVFVSPEMIRAATPAFPPGGKVNVVVISAGGESQVRPDTVFTYTNGPIVDAVNPNFGPSAGGTVVVITGKEFVAPVKVFFGANESLAVNVDSKTQITALTPASGVLGFVNVRVEGAAGVSPENQDARFEYRGVPPEVAGVAPPTGRAGGGETVVITGKGFLGAACPGSVLFGTIQAPSCKVIDDTKIEAVTPAHPTGKTFVIVRTAGGESKIVENFEFVPGAAAPPATPGTPVPPPTDPSAIPITPTGQTFVYDLSPGWNVLLWAGADGILVAQVLANQGGANLGAVIDAIYLINEDTSVQLVYVPGTGRETEILRRGRVYWFHIRGTQAVQLVTIDQ